MDLTLSRISGRGPQIQPVHSAVAQLLWNSQLREKHTCPKAPFLLLQAAHASEVLLVGAFNCSCSSGFPGSSFLLYSVTQYLQKQLLYSVVKCSLTLLRAPDSRIQPLKGTSYTNHSKLEEVLNSEVIVTKTKILWDEQMQLDYVVIFEQESKKNFLQLWLA